MSVLLVMLGLFFGLVLLLIVVVAGLFLYRVIAGKPVGPTSYRGGGL